MKEAIRGLQTLLFMLILLFMINGISEANFEGTIGSRFTITNSGFGPKKPQVYATYEKRPGHIKKVYATVETWSDTAVTCLWTKQLSPGRYNLWVKPNVKGTLPVSAWTFSIINPAINEVTPDDLSPGKRITLNGQYFTNKKPSVYLKDPVSSKRKNCKVLSSNMNPTTGESSLDFIVPKWGSSKYEIYLQTRVGNAVKIVTREILISDFNKVSVFDAASSGSDMNPLRHFGIMTELHHPSGIAVDTINNEIFVANYSSSSINVYARTSDGNIAPIRTISGESTGMEGPIALAVDTVNNEIFVANLSSGSITVYARTANGNVAPIRTISGAYPVSISVDTANNEIYVIHLQGNSIDVYARNADGSVDPIRTIKGGPTGLFQTGGIAVDSLHNEITVLNLDQTANSFSLLVFTRTAGLNTPPIRTITGDLTDLNTTSWPAAIAVDAVNNEIYVANFSNSSLAVYARTDSGNVAPRRFIVGDTTQLTNPTSIAVDAVNNEIFTTNSNIDTITVYPSSASGDAPPVRTISGDSSRLSDPRDIAVDSANNEIYLSNFLNNSVTVYAKMASGAATPARIIQGDSTGLNSPISLAMDTFNNELFVGNFNDTITVYTRNANGNIAPIRVIAGDSTGLSGPEGIAVDTLNNELLVANARNDSVTVYARTTNGNVAPIRTISGAGTGGLSGIAVDTVHNEILVAGYSRSLHALGKIRVFGRLDNGTNLAPLREITSSNWYNLVGVRGIAIDTVYDEIFVIGSSILVYARTANQSEAPLRQIRGKDLAGGSGIALTFK